MKQYISVQSHPFSADSFLHDAFLMCWTWSRFLLRFSTNWLKIRCQLKLQKSIPFILICDLPTFQHIPCGMLSERLEIRKRKLVKPSNMPERQRIVKWKSSKRRKNTHAKKSIEWLKAAMKLHNVTNLLWYTCRRHLKSSRNLLFYWIESVSARSGCATVYHHHTCHAMVHFTSTRFVRCVFGLVFWATKHMQNVRL